MTKNFFSILVWIGKSDTNIIAFISMQNYKIYLKNKVLTNLFLLYQRFISLFS